MRCRLAAANRLLAEGDRMKQIFGALIVVPSLMAGCTATGPNETLGTVGGAVVGGVVGSQFGAGDGRVAATAIGTLAGGLIGQQFGRSLDENSRQRAVAAEYRALEYGVAGQPVAWRNPDTGHYGEVTPRPAYQVNGSDCREYVHTVYIDGRPQTARGTACRQPDGSWRPVG